MWAMRNTTKLQRASLFFLSLAALAGCAPTPVPVLVDGMEQVRYTRCVLQADGDKLFSSNYIGDGVLRGYPPGSKVELTMFSAQRIDLRINNIPHQMFPSAGEFNAGNPQGCFEKYFVTDPALIGLEPKAECPADEDPAADAPAEDAPAEDAPAEDAPAEDAPAGDEGDPVEGAAEAADPEEAKSEGEKTREAAGWRLDKMKPAEAQSVKQGVAAVGMTKEQVYMAFGPPHFVNFDTVATPLDLNTIMEANRWVYYTGWFPRMFTFGLAGKRAYTFDGTKLIQVE